MALIVLTPEFIRVKRRGGGASFLPSKNPVLKRIERERLASDAGPE